MKGSAARLLCVALLVAAVIASPVDKPKKNLKKYLYKKQGPVGEPFLPMPLKTKSNSYPATLSKLPRGEKSFPSVVYISDSPDDEAPEQGANPGASASSGIHDFFDRISRTFGRAGNRDSELVNVFPGDNQDDEAQYDSPSIGQGHQGQGQNAFAKPTAFPSAPVGDHLMNDEEGPNDDEEGSSEEDEENEEDEEEEDEVADDLENSEGPQSGRQKLKQKEKQKQKQKQQQEEAAASQLNTQDSQEEQPVNVQSNKNNKNKPSKNSQKEEQEENQEESDEEEEENDEEELDIPDNVPPYIRQSMIEEHKRKKQEAQSGGQGQGQGHGGRPGGQGGYGQQQGGYGQQGGPGGPGRPDQGGYGGQGGYGQGGPPQQPSGAGGFLSSLLG